jgi:prepilin signal peptidase PulO-like enzyme (type II secretory pathway)
MGVVASYLWLLLGSLGLFFFGASLASFGQAMYERLMTYHKESETAETQQTLWSRLNARSRCSICGHVLSTKDLIPVFSWISLHGKCRYCGTRLKKSHVWLEFSGGISALILFYCVFNSWGQAPQHGLFFPLLSFVFFCFTVTFLCVSAGTDNVTGYVYDFSSAGCALNTLFFCLSVHSFLYFALFCISGWLFFLFSLTHTIGDGDAVPFASALTLSTFLYCGPMVSPTLPHIFLFVSVFLIILASIGMIHAIHIWRTSPLYVPQKSLNAVFDDMRTLRIPMVPSIAITQLVCVIYACMMSCVS